MMRNKTKHPPEEPVEHEPGANPPPAEPATPPTPADGASATEGEKPLDGRRPAATDAAEAAPASPESRCADLEQALSASKDQYVRLLADFDNFRRRNARERQDTIKYANEAAFTELLPVIDHFELALAQAPDPDDAFVVGVRMVFEQLTTTLGKAGLAPIDAQGTAFDPAVHEAVAYQPSPDVAEGQVLMQIRRGYRLADRVIRPATVIVSSGTPPAADAAPETPSSASTDTAAAEPPEADPRPGDAT